MVEAIVAASLGLAGTVFAAYMLHRQKARETAMTGEVEAVRAEDRFRDDLLTRVRHLTERMDTLQHELQETRRQLQNTQAAYFDLRQEYTRLQTEHRKLDQDHMRVQEQNDHQARELKIARQMLDELYGSGLGSDK